MLDLALDSEITKQIHKNFATFPINFYATSEAITTHSLRITMLNEAINIR